MSFLSPSLMSWQRTYRLQKLEKKIAPPTQRVPEIAYRLMCVLENPGTSEKERAFEKFIDLCEADEGVRQVMQSEDLERFDLRGVVVRLLARGMGEWIKGHYVPLSTIAYAEPLAYFVRAERRGVRPQQIYFHLLEYWEGRISSCELVDLVPGTQNASASESLTLSTITGH